MSKFVLMGVSVGFHLGLALILGEIRVEKARAATPIEIKEVAPPAPPLPPEPPPAEPPKPPPPEPSKAPEPRRAPRPAPQPLAEPAPADPTPSFGNLPDFGLALEGGVSTGGLAVRAAPVRAAAPARVVKQLEAAPRRAAEACSEDPVKPKPLSVPQPVYTDAARSAGIEGRVRVELRLDAEGRVIDVKVLQGLGYGLDEAAVAAAKSASFTPAQRCGRPVSATFTIAMRFSAG